MIDASKALAAVWGWYIRLETGGASNTTRHGATERNEIWAVYNKNLGLNPSTTTSCLSVDKLLNLSEPHLSCLWNRMTMLSHLWRFE